MTLQAHLSNRESRLLLFMESRGTIQTSTDLARDWAQGFVTTVHRGIVLNSLKRLEIRGLVARGPDGTWKGASITQLGRTMAGVERLLPRIYKARVRAKHYPAVAIETGRTMFLKRVAVIGATTELLKPGEDNGKVGGVVLKGHLRGYRIYTLTLEERATCPSSCARWDDCYGNNMGLARRWKHGIVLERRLQEEVPRLLAKHKAGVLIRLHVLGDFYSAEYVRLWERLLKQYPKLAVFGYTARPMSSLIGGTLWAVTESVGWRRFAIRFSCANPGSAWCATWYKPGAPVPKGTFGCPEQLGKVDTCGHCAACWEGTKTVAFHLH